MNKKKTIIIFITLVVLSFPSFVFAVEPLKATNAQDQLSEAVVKTGVVETDITKVGGDVLKAALALVAIVFFIIIFYGGFKWLLARGNEEEITKAKGTVIGAIIGLLIVVGAYAITNFITSRLLTGGGSSMTGDNVPGAVVGDPTGCCLDKWQTEGGYFGVGQSGWTGSILTNAQCDVVINSKEFATQKIKLPDDGQWLPMGGTATEEEAIKKEKESVEKACQEQVKTKNENNEWEQSDKNVEWNPF